MEPNTEDDTEIYLQQMSQVVGDTIGEEITHGLPSEIKRALFYKTLLENTLPKRTAKARQRLL